MAAKWIIFKDQFKLGNVSLHEEFINSSRDLDTRRQVKGGGHFRMDNEKKEFTLFGKSYDFGSCQAEDFKGVKDWPTRWKDWTFIFIDDATGERTQVK